MHVCKWQMLTFSSVTFHFNFGVRVSDWTQSSSIWLDRLANKSQRSSVLDFPELYWRGHKKLADRCNKNPDGGLHSLLTKSPSPFQHPVEIIFLDEGYCSTTVKAQDQSCLLILMYVCQTERTKFSQSLARVLTFCLWVWTLKAEPSLQTLVTFLM